MNSHLVPKQQKRVPRGTIGLIFLILFVFALVGCAPKPKGNALVVGMDLSYPPFETIDQDGQPAGVSVELAKALAQYLDRPLKIENIPFTGLIPSLQNGRLDCIISSMTDTPERRKSLDFSDPYLSTGLAMLVAKNSPIQQLAGLDLPGKTVVVRQGTTGELWARGHLQHAAIISMDKENSAVLEVIQGKADAFIYDQMSIWQNAQKNPTTTRALLTPLRHEFWAVGLKLGNIELAKQINAFLAQYRQQGGFDHLANQFLSQQKKAFQEQGIPFVF